MPRTKKGYLDRKQALRVMSNVKDELRLNDNDLRHIMSEADENGDGVIDYNEFLPLAMRPWRRSTLRMSLLVAKSRQSKTPKRCFCMGCPRMNSLSCFEVYLQQQIRTAAAHSIVESSLIA